MGIELRVRYRGEERLVRLHQSDGKWYANILKPGREDLFGECPVPSPKGARLPGFEMRDFTLRFEAPTGNVESLALVRLLASGCARAERGWVAIEVSGIAAPYGDMEKPWEQERAQVLKFPKQKGRGFEPER